MEDKNAAPFSKIEDDYNPMASPDPALNGYPASNPYAVSNGYPVASPELALKGYPAINPYAVSNGYPVASPDPAFNGYPASNPYAVSNGYPVANPYVVSNAYPMGNPPIPPHPFPMPNPNQQKKIRDYLAWSIGNLCCSFVIIGIVAVVLSILVRRRRRQGEYRRAKTLSTITLLVNIVGSIIGFIVWAYIIYVIIAAALFVRQTSNRT